jgi:hypothetical protein
MPPGETCPSVASGFSTAEWHGEASASTATASARNLLPKYAPGAHRTFTASRRRISPPQKDFPPGRPHGLSPAPTVPCVQGSGLVETVRCSTSSTRSSPTQVMPSGRVARLTTSTVHSNRNRRSPTAVPSGSWITWTKRPILLLSGCVQSAKATCPSKVEAASDHSRALGGSRLATERQRRRLGAFASSTRAQPRRIASTAITTAWGARRDRSRLKQPWRGGHRRPTLHRGRSKRGEAQDGRKFDPRAPALPWSAWSVRIRQGNVRFPPSLASMPPDPL